MDGPQTDRRNGSVLIVDSDPGSRQTLIALMESEGYDVRCAPNGQTALISAGEEPPDLVLLEARLPDGSGVDVCRRLKEGAGTGHVPVIFLTALEDAQDKVQGFTAGAADYITKPFGVEEILARVRTHVALYRLQGDLRRHVEEQTAALRAANAQLAQSIERLRRSEESLQGRLQFETLLSTVSAKFVSVASDELDQEIEDAQRRVCECLDLDLSSLWQNLADSPHLFTLTHYYRRIEGPPPPERMDAREYFPWCQQQAMAGKVLAVSSIENAPPEASRDRESWRHFGIKTSVGFPLSVGGGPLFGVLSFNDMKKEERVWSEALVTRLGIVAQIFANALARKQAEEALRESEARLNLAAASAEARLWEIDTNTGYVWTTEQGRAFYKLAAGEALTLEAALNRIYLEDRDHVRRAIEEAAQSDHTVRIEYRAIRPDGSIRWIASRGRASLLSGGRPGRVMGVSLDITERKQMEEQLQTRLQEIERLKQELEQENIHLRKEATRLFEHDEIISQSDQMRRVLAQVEKVAGTQSTVLIVGETGTGKEVIARAIHGLSARKDRPLVTVNCASLPPSLIEGELFGREKGAYTGAMTMMKGRFEFADGSTLFLDEIGELPLDVQAKLLRVLEEGRFERLGSSRTIHADVRILAASNRDLEHDAQEGKFRKDLFYRLNVFPITVPPLRERPDDIPSLVWSFVRAFEKRMGRRIESIPRRTMEALRRYPWPGNVRELRNVIEHAMIVSGGKILEVRMPALAAEEAVPSSTLEEVERKHILTVLEKTRWRLTGEGGAAEQLGLKRTTLQSRMKKLGIKRPTS